jgi:hypothetical protein
MNPALRAMVVKILVCGVCAKESAREKRSVDRVYKTFDDQFGESMMINHLKAEHGIEVGDAR